MRPLAKPNATVYAAPAPLFVVKMKKHGGNQTIQWLNAFFQGQNWYQIEMVADPAPNLATITQKKFYVKKLSNFYGDARHDLIESIGEVCSYCGMPVRDDAEVEHVMPKAWFPDQMLLWSNFLLACRDCNSRKSSRPTGQANDAQGDFEWPHLTLGGTTVRYALISYSQVTDEGKQRVRPVVNKTLQLDELGPLILGGRVVIRIARDKTREVVLEHTTARVAVNIAVMVYSSSDKATALVDDVLKLNTYTDAPDVSDRRMTERTLAWIQAVDAARNLYEVRKAPDAVRLAVVQQVLDTIATTGFWQVWVEVFYAPSARADLGADVVDLIRDYLKDPRLLPGTATTRLYF